MPINQTPDIHALVICTNVFVRKDGKYLMIRRSAKKKYAPNILHPIGGKLNVNEDPYCGALREVSEEAGITIKNMRLEAVFMEIHEPRQENWLIFHFSADYESGVLTETEEGVLTLITPDEIKNENLFPSVKETIDHILSEKDGTVFATFYYDENHILIKKDSLINVCGR